MIVFNIIFLLVITRGLFLVSHGNKYHWAFMLFVRATRSPYLIHLDMIFTRSSSIAVLIAALVCKSVHIPNVTVWLLYLKAYKLSIGQGAE
jgi:hypothetical protein